MLALALGGSLALNVIVQHAVGRTRPPAILAIAHYSGAAFPCGQATTTIACYGMLAMILAAGRPPRTRALLWAGAAVITVLAGASQLYLGANWLTDILGGWALGALWTAIILTAELLIIQRRPRPAAAGRPNTSPRRTRTHHPWPGHPSAAPLWRARPPLRSRLPTCRELGPVR
jgi:undecaprenyl-diphosphatase